MYFYACFHLLSIPFFFLPMFWRNAYSSIKHHLALYIEDLAATLHQISASSAIRMQVSSVSPNLYWFLSRSKHHWKGKSGRTPTPLASITCQLYWSVHIPHHHESSWAKGIFGNLPGHPWQTLDLLSKPITDLSFLRFPSWLNLSSPSEQFVVPSLVLSRCHPTLSSPQSRREPSWLYKQC